MFDDATIHRIGALTLFDDGLHNRVANLLGNGFPNAFLNGVSAGLLFSDGNHNGVRNLLLNSVVDDAIDSTSHGLLRVFPNRAIDGVGNLSSVSFRNVFCTSNLTRNRNFLYGVAITDDLFFLKNDLSARFHHGVALGGELASARTHRSVGASSTVRGLRFLRGERG